MGGRRLVVERTDAPAHLSFTRSRCWHSPFPACSAMAWIFVQPEHRSGQRLLGSLLGTTEAPANIYSMPGMAWALSSHYFPLAYLTLGPALRALDVRMEEAGLMLGASYAQVLGKVTLPLLRPAILSALLLLFVMGMASYEVPRLIGRFLFNDASTTEIAVTSDRFVRIRGGRARQPRAPLHLHPRGSIATPRHLRRRSFATVTGKGYRPAASWGAGVAGGLGTGAMFASRLGCRSSRWYGNPSSATAQPFASSVADATLENYRFILSYPIFLAAVKRADVLLRPWR